MKRRSFLKNTSAAGLLALITPYGVVQRFAQEVSSKAIEEEFLNPPVSAFAQCWYHWMNGNVSKEGITLDMEAMKRIGIGGFQNFDAGTGIPKGPVVYLSPEWLELKKHTIQEAARLGLEFTMHNCPGWSSSGGPWIAPELAMQQLTWSESFLKGGKKVTLALPQPLTQLEYYRDIVVLAYPSLPGEAPVQTLLKNVTSSSGPVNIKQLTGEDPQGVSVQPAEAGKSGWLQVEFASPYQARSLTFLGSVVSAGNTGGGGGFGPGIPLILESSDDGNTFKEVTKIAVGRNQTDALITVDFPEVTAAYFRISSPQARHYAQIRFSGIAHAKDWRTKANYTFAGNGIEKAVAQEAKNTASSIAVDSIIDITQYINSAGVLTWKAPKGNWTILRFGFTPLGTLNRSAPDTGVGLECDKYNPEAITFHFNKMMESLLPTLGPVAQKGKVGLLIDSWEVGMQNWTAGFAQEFNKHNGYDLLKYLPAMTGRVVDTTDTTERFLWDIRRTQGDMIADHYYGKFDQLCNQHGMISYTEPYDRGPMEEMQIGSRVDVNMGEFWHGLSAIFQNNWTMRRTTKLASSIAHINGQKVVGAEAFTGEPESARWQEYPFGMKALGDKMFTHGLNRIIFHRYAHQPHPTALPGMTMGPWGIHFDRTTTWWEHGKSWLTYISRCQHLLQQGLFVADIAYFSGEEANAYAKVNQEDLSPTLPEGYDYDLINGEVLLTKAKAENGRLTLPDGMSYRVLVLGDTKGLTLALATKLRNLVKEGIWLVGSKPQYSLGLRGYSKNDAAFAEVIKELWGDTPSASENTLGNGRVLWGQDLQTVMEKANLKPDFSYTSQSSDAPITYIHRRIEESDVYFIANGRRTQEQLVCTFRVNGKQPELWDAATGKVTPVNIYELVDGQVRVPIGLEPSGSVFVVFRTPASAKQLHTVSKDTIPLLSTRPFPDALRKLYKEVSNTFTISLWAKPELNSMLSTGGLMEGVSQPWTDYYAIYPSSGKELYGEGHATCGLTIGRNGVAVWERSSGKPTFALAAPTPISGWSHIALVYTDGVPAVYINGKHIAKGKKSLEVVHPGLGEANLRDGASFYNGDMTEPQLAMEALNETRIGELAAQAIPVRKNLFSVELVGSSKPELLFWQDGHYSLQDSTGKSTSVQVAGIGKPIELTGPWQVSFPPDRGAPEEITLPKLASLHTHAEDGVKYFSGTATYRKNFTLAANTLAGKTNEGKRIFLDLGQVEVLAGVKVNGKDMGVLWKRPYRVDVTEAIKAGTNEVEIQVTNLWPNRLIGDEQLPPENKYTPGGGASGFASLSNGAIEQLPDWYKQGKPKPTGGRVTFTTWQHYNKDSPLLQSGLIGPVAILTAIQKSISDSVGAQ
jgi:hypothetical protein